MAPVAGLVAAATSSLLSAAAAASASATTSTITPAPSSNQPAQPPQWWSLDVGSVGVGVVIPLLIIVWGGMNVFAPEFGPIRWGRNKAAEWWALWELSLQEARDRVAAKARLQADAAGQRSQTATNLAQNGKKGKEEEKKEKEEERKKEKEKKEEVKEALKWYESLDDELPVEVKIPVFMSGALCSPSLCGGMSGWTVSAQGHPCLWVSPGWTGEGEGIYPTSIYQGALSIPMQFIQRISISI
ncbi:hypothetical protein F5884DRAFT_758073 [Xylogone sp. PMI_703]|nr:hypothetical protein F5884DRAFT_758073 [Xylogone sp. PMI_703]